MGVLILILCKGLNTSQPIENIDEWKELCPPEKGDVHWKDGRSARELAKEWIRNRGNNLIKLLEQSNDFKGVNLIKASPEYESRFDKFGRGRVHDLLLLGRQSEKNVIVSVEAKVDESFGSDTVSSYYMKSIIKQLNNINTRVPDRIMDLIKALFSKPYDSRIHLLQYQLLHAAAGTIAEAKKQGAAKALLVIHVFKTPLADPDKLAVNRDNLDLFVNVISSGKYTYINSNDIIGPITIPGNEHLPSDVEFYIGKIQSE
jgi:hypothetical protein